MKEIIEKLSNLNKEEMEYILLNLMVSEKIKFESLNEMYIKYLETVKDSNIKELSLFSSCLGSYITGLAQSKGNNNFFESQSYVLLKNRLDDKFFDKYLTNRTPKLIQKNEEFLK